MTGYPFYFWGKISHGIGLFLWDVLDGQVFQFYRVVVRIALIFEYGRRFIGNI
ncbi:hypothetical protein [Candidatus Liberibacter asiaticus]|uniref:hypothetical protein n=1 Tax=Liberibacter asiaticus TaxID=34021 RepID=UPI000AF9520E|nr:hypothetical protein [Candidatus Liberibacter asiaticus]KAE9518468.1 hypothetical protein FXW28_03540 [Candidatus Liberibacter asiaticus]